MKTILVPTDYSEGANAAIRFASQLGENTHVTLYLFHWCEILIPTSTPQHMYKEFYEEKKNDHLRKLKEATAKLLGSGSLNTGKANIEYIIADGAELEDTLTETISNYKIDLVVMGTHGATGFKKIFVGSNTAKIIDKANIPVIAVPADFKPEPVEKIGYASDLKDVVTEVGELVKFAGLFHAAIEIFHVYPSFPVHFEVNQANVDQLVTELSLKYPDQKFTIQIIQTYKDNDVIYGIEKYIKSFQPEILAMFTLKRTFWDKLFDASRTEEIAFNTQVPLLTLKKQNL